MHKDAKRADSHTTKRLQDLPTSTLWLRDDAEAPGPQGQDVAARAEDARLPLAADVEAVAQPAETQVAEAQLAETQSAEAQLAEIGASPVEDAAPDVPDAAEARDAGATQQAFALGDAEVRQDAAKYADEVARDDSGFYAWPTTAFETSATKGSSYVTPVLGVAALAGLLLAAWNYTALESARTQLSSVTQAKVAVDRALAEAQGRLTAAEKAVADVKAALSAPVAPAAKAAVAPKP